ncbi:MAG: isochorismatase family protein [Syntrophobacteraceae bacterium]
METGRKTLLLAGLEGHVCIFHTGVGALRLGYRVHIAHDAVSSRSASDKQTGMQRLDRACPGSVQSGGRRCAQFHGDDDF